MATRTVVSLFSGALGLDLGLERAGFDVRVAVECNPAAVATIDANRPSISLPKRIEALTTEEILKKAGLKVGDVTVVTGGPSCQAFSTAGQRASLDDPRGTLFREFLRVVKEARPQFFVMENVRGILSAAVRHRPLNERGPGFPPLAPEEELGSALKLVLQELRATGYYVVFDLVNAADYGVPQARERVLFIGSRDGKPVEIPAPTHARAAGDGREAWVTLRTALAGLDEPSPAFTALSERKRLYMELIPEGENWRSLPTEMKEKALGGAFASWGGRSGFFRRLSWDRPAPALTTRPDSKATMLCHPKDTRPLSIREYARVQQFPDAWAFAGSVPQQYVQIGNAVPVGLGAAVGGAILRAIPRRASAVRCGTVVCHNDGLLSRLANRPKTILNPPRMRGEEQEGELREWKGAGSEHRREIMDYIDT